MENEAIQFEIQNKSSLPQTKRVVSIEFYKEKDEAVLEVTSHVGEYDSRTLNSSVELNEDLGSFSLYIVMQLSFNFNGSGLFYKNF